MSETTTAEQAVSAAHWVASLVPSRHRFTNGNYQANSNIDHVVPRDFTLAGTNRSEFIPAGSRVTFYRRYGDGEVGACIAAIFPPDGSYQVKLLTGGRLTVRRFPGR